MPVQVPVRRILNTQGTPPLRRRRRRRLSRPARTNIRRQRRKQARGGQAGSHSCSLGPVWAGASTRSSRRSLACRERRQGRGPSFVDIDPQMFQVFLKVARTRCEVVQHGSQSPGRAGGLNFWTLPCAGRCLPHPTGLEMLVTIPPHFRVIAAESNPNNHSPFPFLLSVHGATLCQRDKPCQRPLVAVNRKIQVQKTARKSKSSSTDSLATAGLGIKRRVPYVPFPG